MFSFQKLSSPKIIFSLSKYCFLYPLQKLSSPKTKLGVSPWVSKFSGYSFIYPIQQFEICISLLSCPKTWNMHISMSGYSFFYLVQKLEIRMKKQNIGSKNPQNPTAKSNWNDVQPQNDISFHTSSKQTNSQDFSYQKIYYIQYRIGANEF